MKPSNGEMKTHLIQSLESKSNPISLKTFRIVTKSESRTRVEIILVWFRKEKNVTTVFPNY